MFGAGGVVCQQALAARPAANVRLGWAGVNGDVLAAAQRWRVLPHSYQYVTLVAGGPRPSAELALVPADGYEGHCLDVLWASPS